MDEATEARSASRSRSAELLGRAHDLIPGGAHTYAKGDDQYPEGLAPVLERGAGSHVWDVDGNEYIELGSGLRSVTLGHAHAGVLAAATAAMEMGTNFVRPSAIEIEAAERLVDLIPSAEMVKFAKNGSDVTTAAVRLARAVTGRDLVAICQDQPFFSVDDWFIGHTAMPAGVPAAIRDCTVGFPYNDLEAARTLLETHAGAVACLVLEPATAVEPGPGYLEGLRALCDEHGVLLVFDEMITGFRFDARGAQHLYGVRPDLSTFGKAMGNGFAVAALVGRRDLMERGGLRHDHERVFLLSTTHGAETHALAAALEVMRVYRDEDVVGRLHERGERLAEGVRREVEGQGLGDHFQLHGRACNLTYATLDAQGERSQPFRTLFLQETIERGLLAPSFVVSTALSDEDIDRIVGIVGEALCVYRRALEDGVTGHLRGRSVQPVFRPYA
ncbi:MAG TPA: glutamate-1-semialdehyde 2,1-aminomutase [Actinomycetota bacterium]